MDSPGGDWELLDFDFDFYGDPRSPTPTSRSRSKNTFQFDDYFSPNTHLLPVPIVFNPTIGDAPCDDPQLTHLPTVSIDSPINNQAFFVKMKEADQFVDMKMDSPKSPPIGPIPISISPQIDDPQPYQSAFSPTTNKADPETNITISPRTNKTDPYPTEEEIGGGEKLWRWSFTGIGALCSFAAVATVCIINLGSHERNHQKHKARFQIYASEKRIKRVIDQATRLNEVMGGSAGVQLGRAHISYGGHYDSL